MKKLLLIFLLFGIFGCKQPNLKTVYYPSFRDSSKENEWGGDVRLSIVNNVKTKSYSLFNLKSIYKNDTVGFQLLVPFNEDKGGYGEGLQIKSLGKISGNFKNALAELYQVKVNKKVPFVKFIELSFNNLNRFADSVKGKEQALVEGKKLVKGEKFRYYKLFFEDEKESDADEAEIFLNINESAKIVELREKDIEYRKGLISYLSQKIN